jgi:hypothetical protein
VILGLIVIVAGSAVLIQLGRSCFAATPEERDRLRKQAYIAFGVSTAATVLNHWASSRSTNSLPSGYLQPGFQPHGQAGYPALPQQSQGVNYAGFYPQQQMPSPYGPLNMPLLPGQSAPNPSAWWQQ